jgi:Cytidylyltransferase family
MSCDRLPYILIPTIATCTPLAGILPPFSFLLPPGSITRFSVGLVRVRHRTHHLADSSPAGGAKCAFNINDFANLFPGHGGVTDRVDCQLLMVVFSYVYIINFFDVDPNFSGSPDVGKVMSFDSDLSTNEQIELLVAIKSRLLQNGIAFRQFDVSNDAVIGAG